MFLGTRRCTCVQEHMCTGACAQWRHWCVYRDETFARGTYIYGNMGMMQHNAYVGMYRTAWGYNHTQCHTDCTPGNVLQCKTLTTANMLSNAGWLVLCCAVLFYLLKNIMLGPRPSHLHHAQRNVWNRRLYITMAKKLSRPCVLVICLLQCIFHMYDVIQ